MPGDNATMTIDLLTPVAMAEGLRFALREGICHALSVVYAKEHKLS